MKKILVTKPFLPPKESYEAYLGQIWGSRWLTNMGPLATELEVKLAQHLNVNNLLFVTNGTIALQMAIKALDLKGEIITTPFSFVATTNSIFWEGCTPVFVEIDPSTLNIDPSKIEAAITEKTSAIMATHVFGNPCDVEAIQKIADKHDLKIIYDAAHAFNVKIKGRSIFDFGDISTCSLHATKFYHTVEGGLVISKNKALKNKLEYIRNHGLNGKTEFASIGTNAKNSEFHAALGLVNLNYIDVILRQRKKITQRYEERLQNKVIFPEWNKEATQNYGFLPAIFESEEQLLKVKEFLEEHQIFTRRYFHPALSSSLPYMESCHLEITENISKRNLCLPIYYDLSLEDVDKICELILKVIA